MLINKILDRAKQTNIDRHKVYADGHEVQGAIIKALFKDGVPLTTVQDGTRLYFVQMIVAKLVRYCVAWSAGQSLHKDSVHDLGVYAFLLEGYDEQYPENSPIRSKILYQPCPSTYSYGPDHPKLVICALALGHAGEHRSNVHGGYVW